MMNYTIKEGTLADWKEATDLTSTIQHWELSYNDLETYWKAYGKQNVLFLVARNDKDSQFYGCALLAKASGNISTIAMYFVMPELRGKGIGNAIFAKLTECSIREGRNIGLNAASKMSVKYETNLGYNKFPNYRVELISFKEVQVDYIRQHINEGCKVVDVAEVDCAKLAKYDSKIAADYDRSDFIKAWTEHPDGYAKVALGNNGEIVGYAAARIVTNDFMVVSPLYANDDAIAKQLILAVFNHDKQIATRSGFFFSITTTVGRLSKMLSEFTNTQGVANMISQFTKEAPQTDDEKVYSISDIALGFI